MKTITLSKPIRKGEKEYTELTFQDPKTMHILAADGKDPSTAAHVIAMASSLTGGIPEIVFREMSPEDFALVRTEVRLVYARFLGVSRVAIAEILSAELAPEEFALLARAYAEDNGLDLTNLVELIGATPDPSKETVRAEPPSPN